MYDGRLGRFLSVDPITAQYPELTPYQFASNTPIEAIDLDGLEKYSAIYIPSPKQVQDKLHARELLENMVPTTAAKCHPDGQVISDRMNAVSNQAISQLDFKSGQVALPRPWLFDFFLGKRRAK